ncbi:MAG: (d)CMP kinase, partial [Alphaproteobacteria bacterium]|nr:(d)CMP kinase [Alphaproteobacteria bacterium]
MTTKPVIAIDGPAASGKGTIARMLAEHFGFAYLDSGILYRAFACVELALADKPTALLEKCGTTSNNTNISDLFEDYDFLRTLSEIVKTEKNKQQKIDFSSFFKDNASYPIKAQDLVKVVNEIPSNILKSEIIGMGASVLGKIPAVRTLLTNIMREFANDPGNKYSGSVIDGRDIGSVVFPNANCKIFLTADLKIRAERRLKDSIQSGNSNETFESIYNALKARDEQDTSRNISPMKYDDTYI